MKGLFQGWEVAGKGAMAIGGGVSCNGENTLIMRPARTSEVR